nr:4b protein [Lettuce necrotic yellows virus]
MLNVNSVRKHVLKTGSLTSAVGTGTIYQGTYNRYAKKKELNIIVTSSGSNNVIMRQVPLFDKEDLDAMKSDTTANKYLHIGCITVSIEPLLHQRYMKNFGKTIAGNCAIIDSTFRKVDQSIISLHKYDLSKGRADYVSYPNHCLSLTDPMIQKRLSVLLGIKGIDVEPGVELFSICIGYIVSSVNTLHPVSQLGIQGVAINGTESADIDELGAEDIDQLSLSYNDSKIISLPSDEDIYYRSRGSMFSKGRTIKRRTMRTKIPEPEEPVKLTKSQSSRIEAGKVMRLIKNKQIRDKIERGMMA